MTQDIGISLREILAQPGLLDAKLLAGGQGLDGLVKYVNVMEVPDILNWVKEGELLLTTAYSLREDKEAQLRLIPELARKKLTGLAIKPGRYIEKIPDIMLKQAEEYAFPLLELPASASFTDIINPIISEIMNKQASILKRADEVNKRLNQIVLEGGDLQAIVNALSELLGNNLVLAHSAIVEPAAAPPEFADKLDGLVMSGQKAEGLCHYSMKRDMTLLDGVPVSYVHLPITAGKKQYGGITVFEINSAIEPRDEFLLERAATVAALVLVNHLAVTEVERRYYSEFLSELLTAPLTEDRKLRERAARLGIRLSEYHTALVFELQTSQEESEDWEEARQILLQQLMQCLRARYPEYAVGCRFEQVILLLPQFEKELSNSSAKLEQIEHCARRKFACQVPHTRLLLGVGRPGRGLLGLQKSYSEGARSLRIGQDVWPEEKSYQFDALGVWRLLSHIEDRSELVAFMEETVGPIRKYDKERGTELLKTLDMYYECRGNYKKMAQRMFTHYNTVMYRLDRIVQIAQVDLSSATDNLNLQIGLKILKMLEM